MKGIRANSKIVDEYKKMRKETVKIKKLQRRLNHSEAIIELSKKIGKSPSDIAEILHNNDIFN